MSCSYAARAVPGPPSRLRWKAGFLTSTFGNGPLGWKSGGKVDLNQGPIEVHLTGITPSPLFDALVLTKITEEEVSPSTQPTTRSSTRPSTRPTTEPMVGTIMESDLKAVQFSEDAVLLNTFKIPRASSVKFGDLTGDGKMDVVVFTPDYSAYAYDNDGKELWHWTAPVAGAADRADSEAPGAVWDFNGDGRAEVVQWRMIDGKEWLVIADGKTGQVSSKAEWPTDPLPHAYDSLHIAIARLHPGYPDSVVVYSDTGSTQTVSAYDLHLTQRWSHTEKHPKGSFGHELYVVDVDFDDVDEIIVNHLCLDAAGKVIWNHADAAGSSDRIDSPFCRSQRRRTTVG